jgi:hypothetical protein
MEKSIESVWKQGFLDTNAMVIPKLNNLYNKKSIHIVDKFKKMLRINLIFLIIFPFVILPISFFVKIPIMGILISLLFATILIINKKLFKGLDKIDKNVSSYEYLSSFNNWLQPQILMNMKLSKFFYPYMFIAMVAGFWFSEHFQEEVLNRVFANHQFYLVSGIAVNWMLSMVLIVIVLAVFGEKLYKFEMNLMYGDITKKMEELIHDMEDLRAK